MVGVAAGTVCADPETTLGRVVGVSYRVETPVFEGPIDVLVHLVNTHELDVLEIPLAPLVDRFVSELAEHRDTWPLDVVSEFLLLAAILLELKSNSLLPRPEELDQDEELEGWDNRDVLVARLLECRAYAAAAEIFAVLIQRAQHSIPREVGLDDGFVVHAPDLLQGVTPGQLADAYQRATAVRDEAPQVDLSHVTVDKVTVSEAVEELASLLPDRGRASFRALTGHLRTRIEIIVRFLALLELCKLGKVSLGQGSTFGDLEVSWIGAEGPLAPVGETAAAIDDYDG
jgi:segregation and condensation protein A